MRIRIVGNNLADATLHTLTVALYRRLRHIDGIEVRLPTSAAPPGTKSGELQLIGVILFYFAAKIARILAEKFVEGLGKGAAEEAVRQVAQAIRDYVKHARERGHEIEVKVEAPEEQPVSVEPSDRSQINACKALSKAGGQPKYALLIGSGRFDQNAGIEGLICVDNDIEEMRELLLSYPEDFKDETVSTIVDGTHDEILYRIDDALAMARESTIIIYYSGHGRVDNMKGHFYLTACDSQSRRLSISGIEFQKIVDLIGESAARQVGILLDCCYAGYATVGAKGAIPDQIAAVVSSSDKGIYLIGASTATELAFEKPEHGLSAMTKTIIDGVRSGRADVTRRGRVDFDDLYSYLNDNIGILAHQKPVRSVSSSGASPILVHASHPDLWDVALDRLEHALPPSQMFYEERPPSGEVSSTELATSDQRAWRDTLSKFRRQCVSILEKSGIQIALVTDKALTSLVGVVRGSFNSISRKIQFRALMVSTFIAITGIMVTPWSLGDLDLDPAYHQVVLLPLKAINDPHLTFDLINPVSVEKLHSIVPNEEAVNALAPLKKPETVDAFGPQWSFVIPNAPLPHPPVRRPSSSQPRATTSKNDNSTGYRPMPKVDAFALAGKTYDEVIRMYGQPLVQTTNAEGGMHIEYIDRSLSSFDAEGTQRNAEIVEIDFDANGKVNGVHETDVSRIR